MHTNFCWKRKATACISELVKWRNYARGVNNPSIYGLGSWKIMERTFGVPLLHTHSVDSGIMACDLCIGERTDGESFRSMTTQAFLLGCYSGKIPEAMQYRLLLSWKKNPENSIRSEQSRRRCRHILQWWAAQLCIPFGHPTFFTVEIKLTANRSLEK